MGNKQQRVEREKEKEREKKKKKRKNPDCEFHSVVAQRAGSREEIMKDKESNQIDTLLRVTLGGNSFPIKDFEGLFFPR